MCFTRFIFTSFFLLFCIKISIAQKTEKKQTISHSIDGKYCKSSFQTIYIGNENTIENLKEYLSSNIPNINMKNVSLRLANKNESLGGNHFTFEQNYKGFKIFRSQIKVNMDKNGNIKSIFDYTFESTETNDDFSSFEKFYQSLKMNEFAVSHKKELIYFPEDKKIIPALRLEISKGDDYYEIIYDSEGIVIYLHDLVLYNHTPFSHDSIINAAIFLPDPLTSANVNYGAPYKDENNADVPVLNAERKTVTVKANFDTSANLFRLENPYIKISEHSDPVVIPATSPVPDFYFTRSQSGFEDINVFYHVNVFHDYLQSLGFNNLVNFLISADAHALNGQDNSSFIPFPEPHLNFGEGGVDDAEDADVIIHEYCHAVSNIASPNTNAGTERTALDEALGDYMASSYSRSINPFNWQNVFSWDGHNEFWNGRFSSSSDHYPENLQNDLYKDADIWSSTMMEIWGDIGKQNADILQLEALYSYAEGMKMSDAAQLIIQADSALNNGAFYNQICSRFYNRGLLNSCILDLNEKNVSSDFVQLLNTENFASGKEDAILNFKKPGDAIIQLFDITGKLIFRKEVSNTTQFFISRKNLTSGIYFLNVFTEKSLINFKIIRL